MNNQHSPIIQPYQDMLAASPDPFYTRAAQHFGECLGSRINREARTQQLCGHNTPPPDDAIKGARNKLNFR